RSVSTPVAQRQSSSLGGSPFCGTAFAAERFTRLPVKHALYENVTRCCSTLLFAFVGYSTGRASSSPTITIDNFGKVDDHYSRGGRPKDQDYLALAGLGIKSVVDLTHGEDRNESQLVRQAGMKFFRVPLSTESK